MRPIPRRIIPLMMLSLSAACAVHVQTPATVRAAENALVSQAQAFMAGYADDLAGGRREAVIARYDPRGAYFVGQGRKELVPPDSTAAIYRTRWQPPASFAWRDLSYEVVGPDAVVVTGLFDWGAGAGRTLTFSYTGLLLRRDGRWMIRLEDESGAPPPRPAPAP